MLYLLYKPETCMLYGQSSMIQEVMKYSKGSLGSLCIAVAVASFANDLLPFANT
jgi:hypothetical protein